MGALYILLIMYLTLIPSGRTADVDDACVSEPCGSEREKRAYAKDFIDYDPYGKWPLPIKYKVPAGVYSDAELSNIYQAFAEWEAATCVTFKEVNEKLDLGTEEHIQIKTGSGCSSYIGRVHNQALYPPQPINLHNSCVGDAGTPIHEVGHALGMSHEQKRHDRDDFLTVLWDNIIPGKEHNFDLADEKKRTTMGTLYDYGSVMHYKVTSFSKDSSTLDTMSMHDPAYRSSAGGGTLPSFKDAYLINKVYCEECSEQKPCMNGGYTDPKDCSKCRCPPKWSGTLCDQYNSGTPDCDPASGHYTLTEADTFICMDSPNFIVNGYYGNFEIGDECTWVVDSPPGCKLKVHSADSNGYTLRYETACYHYCEVMYKTGHFEHGQRLCSDDFATYSSQNPLLTDDNNVTLLFRAPDYGGDKFPDHYYRGFRMCVETVDPECLKNGPTTTTTTTTTTPTTTTPPTTTTTPTTTTPPTTTTTTTITSKTTGTAATTIKGTGNATTTTATGTATATNPSNTTTVNTGEPVTHTGTKDMVTKGEDNTTDDGLVSGETTNPISVDDKTITTSTTTIITPGEKEEETDVGIIVGGVMVALILLAGSVMLFLFFLWRKKRQGEEEKKNGWDRPNSRTRINRTKVTPHI